MKILVVEDNPDLGAMVQLHLRTRGFAADLVTHGGEALTAAASPYDAMILDLGLPDIDGIEVLRRLRNGPGAALPVLILTARDAVDDRVGGLYAGADDYIVKPFDVMELEARLRAVLRRPGRRTLPVYAFGGLSFDTETRTARAGGSQIDLTPRESAVFETLIRAGATVVVRDALVEHLHGFTEDVSPNALEAIISRLRRKVATADCAVRIESLRGIGYRLAEEQTH